MKRRLIFLTVLVLLMAMMPASSISESEDTVHLARVLYTLCRDEDDATLMKVGTVIMNRVESPWFPDTLEEVLNQAQQFPCGEKYDARTIEAAHELVSGARRLSSSALYYQAVDAPAPYAQEGLVERSGGYAFYASDERE